jgi:hypothetical protein
MRHQFNHVVTYTLLTVMLLLFSGCQSNKDNTESNDNVVLSAKEIYKKAVDATVTVETENSIGSGFFIDSNVVVTNFHVIKGAKQAFIKTNNSSVKYEVLGHVGIDEINDLVLLQIAYNSSSKLSIRETESEIGMKVFTIGSPVGLNKTISEGILSAKRSINSISYLQITAPISHGSSGSPLLDDNCKLIGVAVSGIETAENIGFCIPVMLLKQLKSFKNDFATPLSTVQYTENVTSNTTQPPPPKINDCNFKVGQQHLGGIIVTLYNQCHGLIVANSDIGGSNIFAFDEAKRLCSSYGDGTWRMPKIKEMKIVLEQISLIGGFNPKLKYQNEDLVGDWFYWCSDYYNEDYHWRLDCRTDDYALSKGLSGYATTSGWQHCARPVKTF